MARAHERPQSDSCVELEHSPGNTAVIDLSGSKIAALTLHGVRVMGQVRRANGRIAVSHFCGPIAGPDRGTPYGFLQHGVERDISWLDISSDEERRAHKLVIAGKIIWNNYPDGVYVARTFEVGDDLFRCTSSLLNTKDQGAPYNSRAHLYFLSPKGWEEETINGEAMQKVLKTNGTYMLQDENTVVMPGQYSFQLAQYGLLHGVGWAESNEVGGFIPDWYCLEPTEFAEEDFGQPQTIIAPHSSRRVEWTIKNVTSFDG